MSSTHYQHRAGQLLGRALFLRQQPAEETPTSQLPAGKLPNSNLGLIVGNVVLGLIVLGGSLYWGFQVWKRRRQHSVTASSPVNGLVNVGSPTHKLRNLYLSPSSSIDIESLQKAVLAPPHPTDQQAAWVPQIRTHYGVPVVDPTRYLQGSAAAAVVSTQVTQLEKSEESKRVYVVFNNTTDGEKRSPPPAYLADEKPEPDQQAQPEWLNSPPPQNPQLVKSIPTPPTPPASSRLKSHFSAFSEYSINPLSSPVRSESFAARDNAIPSSYDDSPNERRDSINPTTARSSFSTVDDSQRDTNGHIGKLPRLMIVTTVFTPTMDDELAVEIGEVVRLLSEFQDGWCLIQRVGKRVENVWGVCPKFCLQERKSVIGLDYLNMRHSAARKSGSGFGMGRR